MNTDTNRVFSHVMTITDGDQAQMCVAYLPEHGVLLSGHVGDRFRINNAMVAHPSSSDADDVRTACSPSVWKIEATRSVPLSNPTSGEHN